MAAPKSAKGAPTKVGRPFPKPGPASLRGKPVVGKKPC